MLRYDVTTNDWVIYAPSRTMRPDEFTSPSNSIASSADRCPFCPGHEDMTPAEIAAIRDGNRWSVRAVPNKFPALRIEEQDERHEDGRLFRFMGGCGAHEVIIDSPDHTMPLALQPVDQIVRILSMMQDRYIDLMRDSRFKAIVIFKNHGEGAGTSLAHPHCQLIATPVAPQMLRHKLAIATQYFDQTGRCLYCDLLEHELAAQQRVLAANEHFVALLPYASHVPFEMWIAPRHRQSSFRWVDPALLKPLASLLKHALSRLHFGLGNPDYNLTINTAPRGEENSEYFSWHIQILPRLTTPAGFELGSGMSINTMLPEDATEFLNAVEVP